MSAITTGVPIEDYKSPMVLMMRDPVFKDKKPAEMTWIAFEVFQKWRAQGNKTILELIAFNEELFANSHFPRYETGAPLVTDYEVAAWLNAVKNQPAIGSAVAKVTCDDFGLDQENAWVEKILTKYSGELIPLYDFPSAHSEHSSMPIPSADRVRAYSKIALNLWAKYFAN